MATYRSTAAELDFIPYDRPEGAVVGQEFSLALTAAVANGDIFILGKLPVGAVLLTVDVQVPILDTGTNNATLKTILGTNTDTDALLNASSVATFHNAAVRLNSYLPANTIVSTISRGTLAGSTPLALASGGDIRMTVTAAANTAANSGTITGHYTYATRAFAQPVL